MSYVVSAPLVVLRQKDTTQVHLYQGAPVPDTADPDHVKQLVEAGMLEKPKPAAAPADSSTKEPTVKEILAEVGDDQAKASAALEAEQAKGDEARSSLVEKLKAIVEPAS